MSDPASESVGQNQNQDVLSPQRQQQDPESAPASDNITETQEFCSVYQPDFTFCPLICSDLTGRGHSVLPGGPEVVQSEQHGLDGPHEDPPQDEVEDHVEERDLAWKRREN